MSLREIDLQAETYYDCENGVYDLFTQYDIDFEHYKLSYTSLLGCTEEKFNKANFMTVILISLELRIVLYTQMLWTDRYQELGTYSFEIKIVKHYYYIAADLQNDAVLLENIKKIGYVQAFSLTVTIL